MLNAKAYNQAYGYKEYKEAEDYSDLITAFANDVDQVEKAYLDYGFPTRKRVFNNDDCEEASLHTISTPVERHIDIAFDHLRDTVVGPKEPEQIQKIFDKRINGWNDTHANRVEIKIENAKEIILWFQKQYPIILRKSFYYENNSIYVGNGIFAVLAKGSNYSLIAKILFRDIHVTWNGNKLLHELALLKGITPHTAEYSILQNISLKRACQLINNRVSSATNADTKLVIYSQRGVGFDLSLFHQIDRLILN